MCILAEGQATFGWLMMHTTVGCVGEPHRWRSDIHEAERKITGDLMSLEDLRLDSISVLPYSNTYARHGLARQRWTETDL